MRYTVPVLFSGVSDGIQDLVEALSRDGGGEDHRGPVHRSQLGQQVLLEILQCVGLLSHRQEIKLCS